MDFPRVSWPVAVVLFLLAVLAIVVLPAMCAVDSSVDPETPPDTNIEAVPDALE